MSIKKKTGIVLAGIILFGAFLRLYGLNAESFWLDEGATYYAIQHGKSYILNNIFTKATLVPEHFNQGGEAPFFFLISYYWSKLFGLKIYMLRLPSAIFGIISIYVVFLLGKELFNIKAGLISAFILAINHQHIYYSQEFRMYSLVILLASLSVYFLFKALKEGWKIYWIGYVASIILLLYTHYYGIFILLFEYIYLLAYWRVNIKFTKQIVIASFSIALLYLPYLPVLIKQISISSGFGRLFGKPSLLRLGEVYFSFNSYISPDLQTRISLINGNPWGITLSGWFLISTVLLIGTLLFFLFVIGVLFSNRRFGIKKVMDNRYALLLLWLLIPVIIPFIISYLIPSSSIFGPNKYAMFASPAYYLIVSQGFLVFKKFQNPLLVLLVVLSIIPLYSYYLNFDKPQYKEVANYLKDNLKEGEMIFVHAANTILPLGYYSDLENIEGIKDVDQLKDLAANRNSLWIVLSMERYSDPKGTIKNYLDSHYNIDKYIELTGIKIIYYTKSSLHQT